MTHDPVDSNHARGDIPELFDRLESRVASPDPQAIRAEATRRGAARKRMVGAAAAFVAVLAVAGVALAVTNDSTTTETASIDDALAQEPDGLIFEWEGSVADDSAPILLDGTILNPGQSTRSQMIGRVWNVGAVRGDSLGFTANEGHLMFSPDPDEFDLPSDVDTVVYTNGCSGSAYEIRWVDNTDSQANPATALEYATTSFSVISQLDAAPTAANVNCVESTRISTFIPGAGITIGQSEGSNVVTMGDLCPPLASCAGGVWTADLTSAPNLMQAVVTVRECINDSTVSVAGSRWFAADLPPEWNGRNTVPVTVAVSGDTLLAVDRNALTAVFNRDNGLPRTLGCLLFPNSQSDSEPSVSTTTTLAGDLRVMPELQGYEFNEALNIMFEMELRTSRIDEPSTDVESGHVIRTEPNAGISLAPYDLVTIVVSSGEPKVAVPNVETILGDAAAQRLRADGFEVRIDFEAVEDPSLVNIVLSQSPPPNSNQVPGSTVTIVVGAEAID